MQLNWCITCMSLVRMRHRNYSHWLVCLSEEDFLALRPRALNHTLVIEEAIWTKKTPKKWSDGLRFAQRAKPSSAKGSDLMDQRHLVHLADTL